MPVPKPDTQPTLAYEALQLPVIAEHLKRDDAAIVHAAAVSLKRLITDHKAALMVHEAGLLEILAARSTLNGDFVAIGRLALECIGDCLSSPALRPVTMSNAHVVAALKEAFTFEDVESRRLAYACVAHAAEHMETALVAASAGFVADVVARIAVEMAGGAAAAAPQLLQLTLALRRLVQHPSSPAVVKALDASAVATLYALLADVLGVLAPGGGGDAGVLSAGSAAAASGSGTAPTAVTLRALQAVAMHSTDALMYCCFHPRGKAAAIEDGGAGLATLVAYCSLYDLDASAAASGGSGSDDAAGATGAGVVAAAAGAIMVSGGRCGAVALRRIIEEPSSMHAVTCISNPPSTACLPLVRVAGHQRRRHGQGAVCGCRLRAGGGGADQPEATPDAADVRVQGAGERVLPPRGAGADAVGCTGGATGGTGGHGGQQQTRSRRRQRAEGHSVEPVRLVEGPCSPSARVHCCTKHKMTITLRDPPRISLVFTITRDSFEAITCMTQ